MAYDEALADRVRKALGKRRDLDEKRMFGGLAFMLGGHMCCGVFRGGLIVRVPRAGTGSALKRPHAKPFDFTGKPMRGFVVVAPGGLQGAALRRWVDEAVSHVGTLPPK